MGAACLCGARREDSTEWDIQHMINGQLLTDYRMEQERIVDEMRRADPRAYLGLLFWEYPEKNGSTVREMARRLITSEQAKQKVIGQIHTRLAKTDHRSEEALRTVIEQQLNESFTYLVFK